MRAHHLVVRHRLSDATADDATKPEPWSGTAQGPGRGGPRAADHHRPWTGPSRKKPIRPMVLVSPCASTGAHSVRYRSRRTLKKTPSRKLAATPIQPCSVCARPKRTDEPSTARTTPVVPAPSTSLIRV